MTERVDQLRESLEEPLLVTTGVNVRYLVGFQSSNAALLVDHERVLLFTDFRYAEAARAVEGVEFVQTQRSVYTTIADRLDGRLGFEASSLTYANWQILNDAALELVPRTRLVEKLRAVKDDAELAAIREAARITDEVYAVFAEETFVGRTERDLAWRMQQLFHDYGAHALAFELIVGSGPTGAKPHGRPTASSRRTHRSSSTRAASSTVTTRTAREPSRPVTCRTTSRTRTRSARTRRSRGSRRCARGRAAARPTRPRDT